MDRGRDQKRSDTEGVDDKLSRIDIRNAYRSFGDHCGQEQTVSVTAAGEAGGREEAESRLRRTMIACAPGDILSLSLPSIAVRVAPGQWDP
jgi:hypothetical protein